MLKQLIAEAIVTGTDPRNVLYVSVDTPIYLGLVLEKYLSFMPEGTSGPKLVIFDEIQYLQDWERHLKDLVDSYPDVKFVASGSAAAALRLQSRESGAGRFSDFMLPPLTFYEFLDFLDEADTYIVRMETGSNEPARYQIVDIEGLNNRFIDYLNFGGYPEAVLNPQIRRDREQFIKNDIVEKVLLKDLPSLYGITGVQELNHLFSFLAYNAGNEASWENISKESGLPKETIKKYVTYLESAFLIIKVANVDQNCRSMQRERNFKVYLNNPSMRAALFAPVEPTDSTLIGQLAECAIFSQWQHSVSAPGLRYARWKNGGEVDIVFLDNNEKPVWIGEIKWSDRIQSQWGQSTAGLASLLKRHPTIATAFITTRTIQNTATLEGKPLSIRPSAAYCYIVGRNITYNLDNLGRSH